MLASDRMPSAATGNPPWAGGSAGVKLGHWIAALALASAAVPAAAGPPYLTDDPVPTDSGHWEIYSFTSGEGRRAELDDDLGLDLNYGPAEGVQLTATLPLTFSHDAVKGWRGGSGDVELGVKYRFVGDAKHGFSAAIFPRALLPTASRSAGERMRILLPLWLGKDIHSGTSIFGGGGYELNPGPGNRNFWQAALAITHDLDKRFSVGGEVAWQQPDTKTGTNQTRAGIGSTVKLSEHHALLVSGGPTWADHRTGYHFYAALGLDL
jgi:hypothetical protein